MRAINLVPADARSGRVNSGKSGGAHFALLGALAIGALGSIVYAEAKGQEATANKNLAAVKQSEQAYTQVATQYSSFQSATADAEARIATVKSLAAARFDWAGSLRELGRLIPEGTRIDTLDASVASGTGSGGSAFRSAISSPAISMTGCSPTQDTVANLVTQLQAMRRVTNVTLETSQATDAVGTKTPAEKRLWAKAAAQVKAANEKVGGSTPTLTVAGSGSSSSSGDGACDGYTFTVDVFYAAGGAEASGDAVPSSTPAAAQTVSSTTPATPASSTPTSGN